MGIITFTNLNYLRRFCTEDSINSVLLKILIVSSPRASTQNNRRRMNFIGIMYQFSENQKIRLGFVKIEKFKKLLKNWKVAKKIVLISIPVICTLNFMILAKDLNIIQ